MNEILFLVTVDEYLSSFVDIYFVLELQNQGSGILLYIDMLAIVRQSSTTTVSNTYIHFNH